MFVAYGKAGVGFNIQLKTKTSGVFCFSKADFSCCTKKKEHVFVVRNVSPFAECIMSAQLMLCLEKKKDLFF